MPGFRLEFYALPLYVVDKSATVFESNQDFVPFCSSSLEQSHIVNSSTSNLECLLRLALRHIPQLNDAYFRGSRQEVSRFVRQPKHVLVLMVLTIVFLGYECLVI